MNAIVNVQEVRKYYRTKEKIHNGGLSTLLCKKPVDDEKTMRV